MLALEAHDAGLCPCGCGLPEDWATDKANHVTFETNVCAVGAGMDAFKRQLDKADELAEKGQSDDPRRARPSDGRTVSWRLLDDAEVAALARPGAVPTQPAGPTRLAPKRGGDDG